jgi:hypothetical protein
MKEEWMSLSDFVYRTITMVHTKGVPELKMTVKITQKLKEPV